jgi:hypothetical protein
MDPAVPFIAASSPIRSCSSCSRVRLRDWELGSFAKTAIAAVAGFSEDVAFALEQRVLVKIAAMPASWRGWVDGASKPTRPSRVPWSTGRRTGRDPGNTFPCGRRHVVFFAKHLPRRPSGSSELMRRTHAQAHCGITRLISAPGLAAPFAIGYAMTHGKHAIHRPSLANAGTARRQCAIAGESLALNSADDTAASANVRRSSRPTRA